MMKKQQIILNLGMIGLFLFFSCKKNTDERVESEVAPAMTKVSAVNGILKFETKAEFNSLIEAAKKSSDKDYIGKQIKYSVNSTDFRSYSDIYKMLDDLASKDESKFNSIIKNYPEINSEDAISDDRYFPNLLNQNREVIVADTLYKISEAGVFVLAKPDLERVLIKTKSNNQVAVSLDGARFYSNEELNRSRRNSELIRPVRQNNELALSNLKLKNSDDGCDIENIHYSNDREYKDFPIRKRRLKVKFWSRDWILYESVGIKVVVQKKTSGLFNWWGSVENHDYVKAKLTNFAYRIKKKNFFPPKGAYTGVPSLGDIGNTLLRGATKIRLNSGGELMAFNLRDIFESGILSRLADKIPSSYASPEAILTELINKKSSEFLTRAFKAIDKELGPAFQGRALLKKGFYYKEPTSDETILFVEDTEIASYGGGIIDRQLIKEWQGFLVGISGSMDNPVFDGDALDVSDIEILSCSVIGMGALDGHCVGLRMTK